MNLSRSYHSASLHLRESLVSDHVEQEPLEALGLRLLSMLLEYEFIGRPQTTNIILPVMWSPDQTNFCGNFSAKKYLE